VQKLKLIKHFVYVIPYILYIKMLIPNIVCVCGQKRSGKDTVANILHEHFGYENKKISETLKELLRILFSFTADQLENESKEVVDTNWGITPRQAMQFIGTEVMQYKIQELLPNIGKKFWIHSFIQKHLGSMSREFPPIVISDLRFMHEYEELVQYGALVIRVTRKNNTMCDAHVSEQEFLSIPADVIIENNESLAILEQKVIDFINQTSRPSTRP